MAAPPSERTRVAGALLAALILAGLGLGADLAAPARASGGADVVIEDCPSCPSLFRFNPEVHVVAVGDTVVWSNPTSTQHTITEDATCEPHTTSPPFLPKPAGCLFDSGLVGTGDTFSHTFVQAGTFDYHCDVHHFTGRVVVLGSALPDLVVDPPSVTDRPLVAGLPSPNTKSVVVTVHNTGLAGAPATTLEVGYEYKGETRPIGGTISVSPLPAGASKTFNIPWTVAGVTGGRPVALVGDFTIVARVDPQGHVDETDSENNGSSSVVTVGLVSGLPGTDLADP